MKQEQPHSFHARDARLPASVSVSVSPSCDCKSGVNRGKRSSAQLVAKLIPCPGKSQVLDRCSRHTSGRYLRCDRLSFADEKGTNDGRSSEQPDINICPLATRRDR